MMVKVADSHRWNKKTYNNTISALRRAFAFGYLDFPDRIDPATRLRSAEMGKKDRPRIDPFSIQDAEVEHDFWAIHDAMYRTDLDTLRRRSLAPWAAIQPVPAAEPETSESDPTSARPLASGRQEVSAEGETAGFGTEYGTPEIADLPAPLRY